MADQAAALYQRQHAAMSTNMLELIRLGALALLRFVQGSGQEVTLADLYRLFTRDAFRSNVLQTPGQPWAVVDALAEAEQSKTGDRTLEAVRRQLRRPVTAEALLVTLARKGPGAIDLRQVMQAGRCLAVDVSDATLGPEQAGFLNQAVAAKLQLLTPARQSDPPLFHIVADEAQEFAGSGETFAKAVALAAEYRVAWTLINQSRTQLTGGLETAAQMCASQYYFRQAVSDAPAAVRALAGRALPEDLVRLPKRSYWAIERLQGEPVLRTGRTPELPAPDPDRVQQIRTANEEGPTREQILTAIQKAQQPEVIGLWA